MSLANAATTAMGREGGGKVVKETITIYMVYWCVGKLFHLFSVCYTMITVTELSFLVTLLLVFFSVMYNCMAVLWYVQSGL